MEKINKKYTKFLFRNSTGQYNVWNRVQNSFMNMIAKGLPATYEHGNSKYNTQKISSVKFWHILKQKYLLNQKKSTQTVINKYGSDVT